MKQYKQKINENGNINFFTYVDNFAKQCRNNGASDIYVDFQNIYFDTLLTLLYHNLLMRYDTTYESHEYEYLPKKKIICINPDGDTCFKPYEK